MTKAIHRHQDHDQTRVDHFTDPVCGMSTDDPSSFSKYDHEGTGYYFCSDHCLGKFKEDLGN